ncbi:MAG: SufD family Fe-S cluster assembly protein [Acidimicrobiales bacterium]
MTEHFAPDVLTPVFGATGPFAERRQRAAAAAAELDMPSAETEEWRYSPIGDLDVDAYRPQLHQAIGTAPASPLDFDDAVATIVIINGRVNEVSVDPGWSAKGLSVAVLDGERREPTASDTKLDALHLAFAHQALRITVPDGLYVDGPIVVRNHHLGDGMAAFPHIVVTVGDSASVSIVEHQTSGDGPGLAIAWSEIEVGNASIVEYAVVQDLGDQLWQSQRMMTTVGEQATSRAAIAAFGGAYTRVRTDTDLIGRGAHGDLAAVYYADGDQTLDFRTFQHHRAPNTSSDLLFKGASDDTASSIYTGLIHIHEEGAGSNAHQTNRNIKLSDNAWAWSVPNLEIENNDVRCSHASTVSPIDEDQLFYLHARGVKPGAADRLVVAGFFEEVMGRFRSEAVTAGSIA